MGWQLELMHFISLKTGKTCDEIGTMSENNMEALNALLEKQLYKTFTFKLRSKVEKYQDSEPKTNTTVLNVEKVNHIQ